MRIAITTPFLETFGGVEKVVAKIGRHFDATIYTTRYSPATTFPEFRELDVQVVGGALGKMPMARRLFSAMDAAQAFYSLKLQDYDVVNAHQSPSEFARHHNAPLLWYCHSPNREAFDLYGWRMRRRHWVQKPLFWAAIKAFRHLEFQVVPRIEYIFTNSRNSQQRIRHYLHREAEVLYPGIDAKEFHCTAYDRFFFYPSRIVPEKEIEYALEAFAHFSREHKDWKLVVAGSLSSRPEHQAYYRWLRQMASEHVQIRTNVSDRELRDLYARCRGVLFTPINEDLGFIPLEAGAASKPCIARNEGGPRETIRNGKDGFLVDRPTEMAHRMGELAEDESRAERMGKEGRKKVARDFGWKRFLDRFGAKAKELAKARG